ncbi:SWIM zinc finger family protein [Clostridium transplantifaecale]|uniref:SWIM zinc finger family protein n=1 Tax=Clostridium transplantifaecale TaxID=2479838 RepID=UPI000F63587F|nr:SWIM zinc finger family protein [Clostridium transplantifaecale]
MEWRKLFQSVILDRGLAYYERGLVTDYRQGTNLIRATVQGSEEYDVRIRMEGDKIVDMECDCPYAERGEDCKHMAAVLFYMEEEMETRSDGKLGKDVSADSRSKGGKEDIKKLIEEADAGIVHDFLAEILRKDEKLLSQFKHILGCEISPEDKERFKRQIDQIFYKFSRRQGYIGYSEACILISELEEVLDTDVERMLEKHHYGEAFELTSYILEKIEEQPMDDSDGGIGELAGMSMDIWYRILDSCDLELKRELFKWCVGYLKNTEDEYIADFVEDILIDGFEEEEFLAYKFSFTLEQAEKYKEKKDLWSCRYGAERWALLHIIVMEEQGYPQEKIEEYCKDNLELSDVRKYYIESCIRDEKYEEAIHLLEESKRADSVYPGLVAAHSLVLKDLLKQIGRKEDYMKELWSLVLDYKAGDLEIYKELKALYTEEEWEEQREKVFSKLSRNICVEELYKEEKFYDRLLKNVLECPELYKLTKYENCLKALYPQELLTKYESVVGIMAERASARNQYSELVNILKKMEKYPGGMEKAKEIADSWRVRYKRRKAMMDELNRL